MKGWLRYDDALDVWGVHGVGGTVGLLVAGVCATAASNPNLTLNLASLAGNSLWREQLKGIGITLGWTTLGTALVALVVQRLLGLRSTIEAEVEGLDVNDHDEEGYIYEPKS